MSWTWFDLAWPWIGAIFAVVILILLFGTNRLRSLPAASRWRDRVWLSWLAAAVYLIHNIEEYGIDALGRTHSFPDAMCTTFGLSVYPACPIPPVFYLAVNLTLIWIAAPLAALLSRKHALVGLVFYGLLFTNGMAHVVPLLLGKGFGPGTLTAIILFIPLFFWVARTCFGPGRIPYRALAVIVAAGAAGHAVLLGSLLGYLRGRIGTPVLVLLQLANAALFLLIPWIGERRLHLEKI